MLDTILYEKIDCSPGQTVAEAPVLYISFPVKVFPVPSINTDTISPFNSVADQSIFLKYEFLMVLLFPLIISASPSVSINKQPLTVDESTLAVFPDPVPKVVALAPDKSPSILLEWEG